MTAVDLETSGGRGDKWGKLYLVHGGVLQKIGIIDYRDRGPLNTI